MKKDGEQYQKTADNGDRDDDTPVIHPSIQW
jgi:hypothetical protein